MSKLEEGKKLFEDKKFEEALPLFTAYLSKNDNHGDALFYRGLCYRKLGKFQESVNDLTILITRLPEEADLYSERGVSYFHLKDYKTALVDMNKAVELQPENPYRYSSRAYIRAYLDVDGAIADYEKATIIDPKDDIAYNNLGLLLEKRGKLKAAQQKFRRSDELSGANINTKNENSVEVDGVTTEDMQSVEDRIDRAKETVNQAELKTDSKDSLGKVMLDVFRDKETRKEYFSFLKGIFKK